METCMSSPSPASTLIQTITPDALAQAAAILRQGGLVAFPTETVYGLGADACNPQALKRLYAVKGRPKNHPVIVHIGSADQLSAWAKDIPEAAWTLAHAFWPGPLTLILQKKEHVPDAVTGGQDTVGLRVPSHPGALALLQKFQGGIAAPSANRFGKLSPTTATHVAEDLGHDVDLILDGGPCTVGVESTIVAFPDGEPRILRPGMIGAEQIQQVLGAKLTDTKKNIPAPRVSGSLSSHYAPRTPVHLLDREALLQEIQNHRLETVAVLARFPIPETLTGSRILAWQQAPENAEDYARTLYANLRQLDQYQAAGIYVETVPEDESWSAIQDRLRRASYRG